MTNRLNPRTFDIDCRRDADTQHEVGILERYRYYKDLQAEFSLDKLDISSRKDSQSILVDLNCQEFERLNELIEDRAITQGRAHQRFKTAIRTQRRLNPRKTMAQCGLYAIPVKEQDCILGTQAPRLSVTVNRASFSGLQRCNSAYCVHCAARYRQERMERIHNGLKASREAGESSYFLTMTIPRSNDAKAQIKGIQYVWKLVQHRLKRYADKHSVTFRTVRALDTTFKLGYGETYHNHLHIIVTLTRFIDGFKDALMSMVLESGAHLNTVRQAQKIIAINDDNGISRYCAKWEGLSKEMMYKEGKVGRMSPYGQRKSLGWLELLGECERGNRQAIQIYREFILAVKSQKTIAFSRNWLKEASETEHIEEMEELWGCDISPATWCNIYGLREDIATTAYYLVNSHKNRERNDRALEELRRLLGESPFDKSYRLSLLDESKALEPNLHYAPQQVRDDVLDWLSLNYPHPLMPTLEA